MIIKKNELLAPYTSFKIGGRTPKMYIPQNQRELIDLIKELNKNKEDYYILGNGTNILINDKGTKKSIINIREACNFIHFLEGGVVEVGSSFDLRKFIRSCVARNLKAPTQLVSIPATIGGAIYMNAGRGDKKISISENLLDVEIFDTKKTKILTKDECDFNYRYSIFHRKKNWVILRARFKFNFQEKNIGIKEINETLKAVRDRTYFKHPSAGSIFKCFNFKIMKILKGLRVGDAAFSKKDLNVILNLGNAKYYQVKILINLARALHFLLFKKCELEIEIWT